MFVKNVLKLKFGNAKDASNNGKYSRKRINTIIDILTRRLDKYFKELTKSSQLSYTGNMKEKMLCF